MAESEAVWQRAEMALRKEVEGMKEQAKAAEDALARKKVRYGACAVVEAQPNVQRQHLKSRFKRPVLKASIVQSFAICFRRTCSSYDPFSSVSPSASVPVLVDAIRY